MSHLSLIIKTVERCNLNCSYCYFFNGLDDSYLKRPKFIKRETIDQLTRFLNDSLINQGINDLIIGLHGGEPLMQSKEDFIYLIEKISSLGSSLNVDFTLQTNATLVTKEWANLLNKYKVSVGVSIDGLEEYNDKYRIDHYGNGSYNRAVKGVKILQDIIEKPPGCLTVIDPNVDSKILYKHLVDLGFERLDFLLPDNNHFNPPKYQIKKYSEYLINIFDEWIINDNAKISIRKFKSMIIQLLGGNALTYGFGIDKMDNLFPLISIRSDGSISPTDELMSTNPETVTFTGLNVATSSLKDVLSHPIFTEIKNAQKIAPNKCSKCCWYNACGGGNLVGRFSTEKRFSNHSIYCEAFEELFAHISAYLINSGVSRCLIIDNLLTKNSGIDAT